MNLFFNISKQKLFLKIFLFYHQRKLVSPFFFNRKKIIIIIKHTCYVELGCKLYLMSFQTCVTRLGRWIDFDNDYKTLYPEFMESVWYVFFNFLNGLCCAYVPFKVKFLHQQCSGTGCLMAFPLRGNSISRRVQFKVLLVITYKAL